MLDIKNLNICYGKKQILNNVNLVFEDSSFNAILGVNGAGKTTLFKSILGLIKPASGEILVENKNIKDISIKQKAKLISYMPQILHTPFNYQVFDMVAFGLEPHTRIFGKIDKNKIFNILEMLNIYDLAYQGVQSLSGGQKALVLLARCILQDSKILLLDEPIAYLDIKNQKLLLNIISSLKKTIIINIHDPSLALDYATNIIAIKNQNILFQKNKDDVVLSDLEKLYEIDLNYHKSENMHFVKAI
ncbi:MAG: ABC transporter ATP-binding protein [Helicobacteraceae bacterium]|nr:ABC transporter ATP-binding protein [Helicobacteraceae bacterium]